MRRTAAVLLSLLTATAGQVGMSGRDQAEALVSGVACCCAVPLSLMVIPVILLAIYDWRKARRPAPPPE